MKKGIYRHFKGTQVEVFEFAKDSETKEEMVVYRHLEDGQVWVRSRAMFEETIERDGKNMLRFSYEGPAQ